MSSSEYQKDIQEDPWMTKLKDIMYEEETHSEIDLLPDFEFEGSKVPVFKYIKAQVNKKYQILLKTLLRIALSSKKLNVKRYKDDTSHCTI